MKHFVVLALISSLLLLLACTSSAHPLDSEPQKLTLEDVDAQPIDDGAGVRVARFLGGGRGGICCGGGGGGGGRRGGGGFGRRGGFGGGGGSASASASASASSSFGK